MHKSGPDADYCKAFKLQEMGTDGKGSLEISDLESTNVRDGVSDAVPQILLQ